MWSILEVFVANRDGTNRKWAMAQCSCGTIKVKRLNQIINGYSKHCKACASRKVFKDFPNHNFLSRFKGVGGLSLTHFSYIQKCANIRNLEFNISIEFLWNLFLKQDKKCALSNVDIILENSLKNHNVNWDIITASVDRIDNTRGYTEDNVQWVHKDINKMKWAFNQDDFINWCKLVSEKHK